ncbi:hypothetical protein FOZ60_009767 [Perkinsus olseni]|uniref:Uncharacterized protein n=1 Tax=Perkinsus olseni TaxID=32597 RepID=A0A7J6NGN6_PEROL|nr:hypothetical protein FOZ60_009767 [Perkinsus olseni]
MTSSPPSLEPLVKTATGPPLAELISTILSRPSLDKHPLAVEEGVDTPEQLLQWAEKSPKCEVATLAVPGKPYDLVQVTPVLKRANDGSRGDSFRRALIASGVTLAVPSDRADKVEEKKRKAPSSPDDSDFTHETRETLLLMNGPPLNADANPSIGFMQAMGKMAKNLKTQPMRLYTKECAEGEPVAVTWCAPLDSWVINSGGFSLLVKEGEDDYADDSSHHKAIVAASAWFELLSGKDIVLLMRVLDRFTLFGTFRGKDGRREPLLENAQFGFTWCGFTVKTVGAASPCVHPEEAASLLQACGLAQDDEGRGLRVKDVGSGRVLPDALREVHFCGIPESAADGDLLKCEYARTALYLCGGQDYRQVLLADFSETAKFRLLDTMRHELSSLAGRAKNAEAGVKGFQRRCERILNDRLGGSYAFQAYVTLFATIGHVAQAEGKWNSDRVREDFCDFAREAVKHGDETPKKQSLVVLIHAPPGVVPSSLLTRATEVTSMEMIVEMVRRGGRHVARMRDISVMKWRQKPMSEVKVVSVGWDGSVDDVIMRSFETAGRMNLCGADVKFFEMGPEDQVEEITRCYEEAREHRGEGWSLTASTVEDLPTMIEELASSRERRIVIVDAPPGYVPRELITDDVAASVETLEKIGKNAGRHVLYAPGWSGGAPVSGVVRVGWNGQVGDILKQAVKRTKWNKSHKLLFKGERRFASAKLDEQTRLIDAWLAQQSQNIPDALSVETVSDRRELRMAVGRLLRQELGKAAGEKAKTGFSEGHAEAVGLEHSETDPRIREKHDSEEEESKTSAVPTALSSASRAQSFDPLNAAPIVEAEVVPEGTQETMMSVAEETTDGDVVVPGSTPSAHLPASPGCIVGRPRRSGGSLEVADVHVDASNDVPMGIVLDDTTANDAPSASVKPDEQVNPPSEKCVAPADTLTEGETNCLSRVEETKSRRGMVVIIHAPPGVVPRDLLTEDGVPGERQIQKLLDDRGDCVVHACTVGFLFRFKFPHERVAVIKYGWEGAIQDVITRTLAHAGDDNKSTQDERFFASDMSEQGGLFARWYKQASKKPPRGVYTASPASEKALLDAVHRMLGDTPRASRTVLLVLPLGLPGSGASQLLRTMFDKVKVKRVKLLQGKSRVEADGFPDAVVSNAALINARDFAKKGAMDSTALGAALRRASGDFVERNVRRSKQASTHVVFLDLNHTNTHSVKTSAKNFMINGVDVKVLALFMAEVPGTTELASWQYPWSPQGILSCLKRKIDSHGDSEGFDSRMTEHFFELCKRFEKYKCPQTSRLIREVKRVPIVQPVAAVNGEDALRGLEKLLNVRGTFSEDDVQQANDLAGMIESPADSERSNLDSISDEILSRITAIASES